MFPCVDLKRDIDDVDKTKDSRRSFLARAYLPIRCDSIHSSHELDHTGGRTRDGQQSSIHRAAISPRSGTVRSATAVR